MSKHLLRMASVALSAVFVLVLMLIFGELIARFILKTDSLKYTRPWDPLFVSGDFQIGTRNDLISSSNGPLANGYEQNGIDVFLWNGRETSRSSTALSDFLFRHYLSRYSSQEVDEIVCGRPNALLIYVLGGSLAVGSSATSKESTWHALLENSLRKVLKRSDVFVVNAAMGAFNSTQEKLSYYMAVVPRGGRYVLILNSFNDLFVPYSSGTRPGDPFQLGTRYGQFYGNPLVQGIAERSALVNFVLQRLSKKAVAEHRNKIDSDEDLFKRYADSAINIYLENMSAILADCEAHKRICSVGVQPSRAFSELLLNKKGNTEYFSYEGVEKLYQLLQKRIAENRYAKQFIDLTRIIQSEDQLSYFTDDVHLNDKGQLLLVEGLLPKLSSLILGPAKPPKIHRIISCKTYGHITADK